MGCKVWAFAEACNCAVQFGSCQGVKKGKQAASSTKWGLGEL